MKWLRNVVRSGLRLNDEYQSRRGILLSNYIALILCGCILFLYVLRRIIFAYVPGVGITLQTLGVGLTVCLAPIIINRAGLTTLSRVLLCYLPVFFVWYAYLRGMKEMAFIPQSAYDSERIHLLTLSFIPYLLLDKKKPFLLILGIVPTLLSLLFFDFTLSQFGLGVHQRGLPDEQYMLMGSRTFVAYCIISLSCFIFQSIITYNDNLNKKILSELKTKSELIKSQNEELVQSQEQLNEVNMHLEDLVFKKTESIKQQNKVLLKYAFSNAHHVRGPIARVLGLIQISKLETDIDYTWVLEKLEHEIKSADEIIIELARELEEINQLDFNQTISQPND